MLGNKADQRHGCNTAGVNESDQVLTLMATSKFEISTPYTATCHSHQIMH